MHEIFDKIEEKLNFNIQNNENSPFNKVDKNIDEYGYLIYLFDNDSNVKITVSFFDESNWKESDLENVNKQKIKNGDVTYGVSAQYINEGIDPGYYMQGNVETNLKETCFNIYEKALELRGEMIENEKQNIKETRKLFEEAEPASKEEQFEVNLFMECDSKEEFELLSGSMNKTNFN